jgi:hypothetical protein
LSLYKEKGNFMNSINSFLVLASCMVIIIFGNCVFIST